MVLELVTGPDTERNSDELGAPRPSLDLYQLARLDTRRAQHSDRPLCCRRVSSIVLLHAPQHGRPPQCRCQHTASVREQRARPVRQRGHALAFVNFVHSNAIDSQQRYWPHTDRAHAAWRAHLVRTHTQVVDLGCTASECGAGVLCS